MLPIVALLLSVPRYGHPLVGGNADPDGRFAAVILMIVGPEVQCSGTKIGPRSFLTAGHCVVDMASGGLHPAFRTGGRLRISNAPVPGRVDDFIAVEVARTRLAPAFGEGLRRFIAFKDERIAGFRKRFADAELQRRIETLKAKHHFTTRFPDAAVVEVASPTPTVPIAQIDTGALGTDDRVTLVGYGCESLKDRAEEARRYPFGRRRWGATEVIRVDPVNFYSYAALMQSGAPSLCPGDSGGPVMRGGRVAGVHGTVYGVGLADGAHSNMSVNLHSLRNWEALRDAVHHRR